MKSVYGDDEWIVRRACLSILVASDLLTLWQGRCDGLSHGDVPSKLLNLARRSVSRFGSKEIAMQEFDELWDHKDVAEGSADHLGMVSNIPFTCGLACLDAIRCYSFNDGPSEYWDEIGRGEITEIPQTLDEEDYECHYYASSVWSEAWLHEGRNVERRRMYWKRWLNDFFAQVNRASLRDVLKQVDVNA